MLVCGCWTNEVAEHFKINIPVKGHKHIVFNVSTQIEQLRNLPLVADLVTGVYLSPEGEDYIVGYDGNGEWSSDDLNPNYNSWNEIWEHLYHRFPNVFDAAKMEGLGQDITILQLLIIMLLLTMLIIFFCYRFYRQRTHA